MALRRKRDSRSWFAAGPGLQRAMGELSDAAFKLFVHVCLHAERATGCLEFERERLARELGKSRTTLGRCLRELAAKGVCEVTAAGNQHRRSRLRVNPEYWPYELRAEPVVPQPGAGRGVAETAAYVAEVRRLFTAPACVQGGFGPADARLAAEWQRAGVALEAVRRAILLGSVRKSLSLLDRPDGEPVRSLRYFASLLEEVRRESYPDAYWQYLEFHLRRCERLAADRRNASAGSA